MGKTGRRAAAEVSGVGSGSGQEAGQGEAGPWYIHTRMLTPLIDGLGHATWSATVPVSQSRTP